MSIAADKTVIEVWDDDFDLGLSEDSGDDDTAGIQPWGRAGITAHAPTLPQQDSELVGIRADKQQTEAWDDDFDLGSHSDGDSDGSHLGTLDSYSGKHFSPQISSNNIK